MGYDDGKMDKAAKSFRCYVRPEGKRLVAICVDLNLYATGETAEEAKQRLHQHLQNAIYAASIDNSLDTFLSQTPSPTLLREYQKAVRTYRFLQRFARFIAPAVGFFLLVESALATLIYTEAPDSFCPA